MNPSYQAQLHQDGGGLICLPMNDFAQFFDRRMNNAAIVEHYYRDRIEHNCGRGEYPEQWWSMCQNGVCVGHYLAWNPLSPGIKLYIERDLKGTQCYECPIEPSRLFLSYAGNRGNFKIEFQHDTKGGVVRHYGTYPFPRDVLKKGIPVVDEVPPVKDIRYPTGTIIPGREFTLGAIPPGTVITSGKMITTADRLDYEMREMRRRGYAGGRLVGQEEKLVWSASEMQAMQRREYEEARAMERRAYEEAERRKMAEQLWNPIFSGALGMYSGSVIASDPDFQEVEPGSGSRLEPAKKKPELPPMEPITYKRKIKL